MEIDEFASRGYKFYITDLANDRGEKVKVHQFTLTPEMKQSVLYEGQPMFQKDIKPENRIKADDDIETIKDKLKKAGIFNERTGDHGLTAISVKWAIDNLYNVYNENNPILKGEYKIIFRKDTDLTHLVTAEDGQNKGFFRYASNKVRVLNDGIDKFFKDSQISLARSNGDVLFIKLIKNNENVMIVTRPDGQGNYVVWSINPGKSDKKVKQWITDENIKSNSSYGNLPSGWVTVLKQGKSDDQNNTNISDENSEVKLQRDIILMLKTQYIYIYIYIYIY